MEQNHYELLYIVSIKHIEDDLQRVRDAIKTMITDLKGTITLEEVMGKQRLAYPIKHIHQGTYVVNEFNAAPEAIKALDRQLMVMPELLRHMIIKAKQRTAEEIEQEKKLNATLEQELAAKMQQREAASGDAPTAPEAPVAAAPVKPTKPEAEVKKTPEKPKASLEDLDKKLDEILTEEVL